MKKAIKITGIVFGVLFIVATVILAIYGVITVCTGDVLVDKLVQDGQDEAVARTAVLTTAVIFFTLAVYFIPAAVFSFIAANRANNENPSRGKFIALGVLNVIFASEVVGALCIVHGAINGK